MGIGYVLDAISFTQPSAVLTENMSFEEEIEELYRLNADISLSLAIQGRGYTKADVERINQHLGAIIKRLRELVRR